MNLVDILPSSIILVCDIEGTRFYIENGHPIFFLASTLGPFLRPFFGRKFKANNM